MDARKNDEWKVIPLPASMTHNESGDVESLFRENAREGSIKIIADASEMTLIDSMGIGFLVKILKEIRALGGDIHIRNLRGQPFKVFKQCRLDWVFTIQSGGETYKPKEEMLPYIDNYSLGLEYESIGDIGVFHLSGMMCFPDGVRKFKEELLVALADRKKILLSFKKLNFLDIQSVNEIFNIYFILKTSDGDIRISDATGLTKDILEKFGVTALIPEYDTIGKAIGQWAD